MVNCKRILHLQEDLILADPARELAIVVFLEPLVRTDDDGDAVHPDPTNEALRRRLVERRSVVRCICSAEPDARSLIAAQVSERFVHPCVHGAESHVQAASGGADGEEEDESGAVVSSS